MGKILCIEGPEGAGKSQLIKELQEKWPGPSICAHFAKGYSTEPEYIYAILGQAIKAPENYLTILDRCWLSDMVYAWLAGEVRQWGYEEEL